MSSAVRAQKYTQHTHIYIYILGIENEGCNNAGWLMVEMVNKKAERKTSQHTYLYSTLCNVKRSEISKDIARRDFF